MKLLVKAALFTFLFSLMPQAHTEIIFYKFDDTVKEERFNHLITVLRCPKCQNNNLADSNAPLSVDLKDIIYEKIKAGESDEEIIGYLKERYGDFISYKPPMNSSTMLLWFGPFLLLVISAFFIIRYLRMAKASPATDSDTNEEHLTKIQQWQSEVGGTDIKSADSEKDSTQAGDKNA